MTKRKVTAKERVLAVYENAAVKELKRTWIIAAARHGAYICRPQATEAEAWADAARKLENPNG